MDAVANVFGQFLEVVQPDSIGDIFIYIIFFMSFIALLPMPDGNDTATYLLLGVMLMCILDLLRQAGDFPVAGSDNEGFFTFIIHIIMFVFLFITAGVVRSNTKQKAGPVIPIAILTALIAVMYAVSSFFAPDAIYAPF